MSAKLTQERLKQLLSYDPITGIFTWLETRSHAKATMPAGHINTKGYIVIGIDGRVYKAHRLAALWMTGAFPTKEVDHRDLDKSNNAWTNLREATTSENKANNRGYRNMCRELPKGVYRASGVRKAAFVAQIRVRGHCHYLGTHPTPAAAAEAYRIAALHHFGEYANGR